MYLAASGAMVQQLRLEMLANNIANVNTIGYKGEKSVFRVDAAEPGTAPPEGGAAIQPLSPYAPPFYTVIDFSQGAVHQTGNPLDVAINGNGFFSIQTPDGVQYTRQGSFTLDPKGVLVTQDGYPVLGEGGSITIDNGQVAIGLDGSLSVDGDTVGQLKLTQFDDEHMLKKAGHGRFALSDPNASGTASEETTISQGFLETANVNPVQAMTEMIETSRAFEAYQKVIQTADDATGKSISEVGRTI
jgi:flagellar basal-body rod protein FlgG